VIDNVGGGMILFESTFTFHGNCSTFHNNTGYLGGGITIVGTSHILFFLPTMLEIIENHADLYGGGIFVYDNEFLELFCTFNGFIFNNESFYSNEATV